MIFIVGALGITAAILVWEFVAWASLDKDQLPPPGHL